MKEKLSAFIKSLLSRKFLYPIIFAGLIYANQQAGNFLSEAQITDLSLVIVAYIIGEATIDSIRIYTEGKK